jgi:medium-chain acyl-[acyl-carrier-protein] hydrolase
MTEAGTVQAGTVQAGTVQAGTVRADPRQALIRRLGPERRAGLRLLCIPQAGAGTAVFRPLAAAIAADLYAVQLPGRETRRREPPYRQMDQLLDALVSALDDLPGPPLALLGYCSGAFVAFELARRLARTGHPLAPVRLIACAAPGPQVVDRARGVHRKTRPHLVSYLREYEITPELILGDESVFAVFEPAIRADFELFEAEPYRPGPPLDLPVSVIGGRDDLGVEFTELLAWRDVTAGEFSVRLLPGGHGFISTATAATARAISAELA